jgi:hypothetical protein
MGCTFTCRALKRRPGGPGFFAAIGVAVGTEALCAVGR